MVADPKSQMKSRREGRKHNISFVLTDWFL